MPKKDQKLDRFDHLIPVQPSVNPWQADGTFRAYFDLLRQLLSVAVGTAQQSGVVAAAADVWAVEELRRAGFDPDEVWPRRVQPRVLPGYVRNFIEGGALTKELRAKVEARLTHSKARKACRPRPTFWALRLGEAADDHLLPATPGAPRLVVGVALPHRGGGGARAGDQDGPRR